jgi:hypothetical protein
VNFNAEAQRLGAAELQSNRLNHKERKEHKEEDIEKGEGN